MKREFFIDNRREFAMKLPNKCAAFIFAGESKSMSADTDYRFLPDRNFYYLTGLSCPEALLIVVRDENLADGFSCKLFVKDRNPMKERWTGKRLSFEEITLITGVDEVESDTKVDDEVFALIKDSELSLALDGSSIMNGPRLLRTQIAGLRTDEILDVADTLIRMRMVKKPCEIEAITKASAYTENAVHYLKEFMTSYLEELNESGDSADEIWPLTEERMYAALEYGMAKQGSLIPAFETIVAVDDNVFYLHHSEPERDKVLRHGNLIQLDLGARFDGYCADISRAIYVVNPALLSESDQERHSRIMRLHDLVVSLRHTAYEAIKPGINFKKLNAIVKKVCGDWLVSEGFLDVDYKDEDVASFYWHNTGHHLGLDVHDVAVKDLPFEAGNVLAIEPGVYIEKWGIGFRIEDDVLVTERGCELLSSGCDDLEDFIFESSFID